MELNGEGGIQNNTCGPFKTRGSSELPCYRSDRSVMMPSVDSHVSCNMLLVSQLDLVSFTST